jgi:cation:H+ antiporter
MLLWMGFIICTGVILYSGTKLSKYADILAEKTGLGRTFVGTIFIGLSTSLPEIVVSVDAVKIRAVDLAIGNIFGSNIFNILVLAVDDLFFVQGPLFSYTDPPTSYRPSAPSPCPASP